MIFKDFEHILSQERLRRYVNACHGDTRKAMTLYRLNLRLSQEMFTLVSCFEVALRNAIDDNLIPTLGGDWLRDSVILGGRFHSVRAISTTCRIINDAYLRSVSRDRAYLVEYIPQQAAFVCINTV